MLVHINILERGLTSLLLFRGGDDIRKLKKYTPTKFMLPTSHYDKDEADFVVNFIQSLSHTKGDFFKEPFILIDWQEQLVRDIFGTLKPDGTRQFTTTAYVEISKKSGKSELAAAIALYMLCADGEQRAEVYGCAADRDQASLVFDVACDMVRLSKALKQFCDIKPSRKTIHFNPTNSVYKALSADVAGKSGVNVSALIFDELWVQKDRKFFDMMTKGTSDARKNPLHDEAVWAKANPSLNITIDIEKVRAACESAKMMPNEENAFRQLRLNQWVKQTVRWMPMECAFPVNEQSLEGRVCYGGLDLSSTTDLTAFVLVFPPEDEDDKYVVLPYFWLPEETLSLRVRRDHVPYDLWERQGFIKTTEGNVVHYGYIEKFIEELGTKYNIREIAFDRWGAAQMVQNLEGMGFTVVPFGQGYSSMSPPTKELMKLVLEKKIAHGGHPVLRWNVDNISIRTDPAGNIKADKEKSTEKIDGAIATIMALDRAIRCGNDQGGSVYDDRGLLFI